MRPAGPEAEHPVKDVVCGMMVDPHATSHRALHGGHPFYFCSARCREQFEKDPARYLSPEAAKKTDEPMSEGTIYTCPMHPEIRQVGPGSCPICGMSLEPALVTLEAAPNPELVDMRRRFWIGTALTVSVVILSMGGELTGLADPTARCKARRRDRDLHRHRWSSCRHGCDRGPGQSVDAGLRLRL